MSNTLIPTAVATIALLYAGVRWFEWAQTFHPRKAFDPDPEPNLPSREDISFYAEDGTKLHGWWFANENARGTVIYCHGNAGNISTRWDVYKGLLNLGLNVFAFDYRGYGKSRGLPREKGLYRDARAAYEVVRAKYEDDENPPVIVYGASLGGAVAATLASEKPVRGLIIEGGFTSSLDVGERWFPGIPIKLILNYKFDAGKLVSTLDIPKLISHSTIDKVIPHDLGVKLYDAASQPKTFVTLNGEHGEAGWQDTPHYFTELKIFVDRIFPPE